jgi:hypothetical protein
VRRHRLEYSARFFRRLEDIRDRIASENPEAGGLLRVSELQSLGSR